MMISPELYAKFHEDDSYEELLSLRDELLKDIRTYEKNIIDKSAYQIKPSLDVIYQCNLLYVSELCKLIQTRFNEKYEQVSASSLSD